MSPPRALIFWLLLAATISIDVIAFSRTGSSSAEAYLGADIFRAVVCDALLASELSVVCIWAVLGTNKLLWVPAVTALLAATIAAAHFEDSSEPFVSRCHLYLSLYGFETALLITALWIFRGSYYWRRRTDAGAWRFSLAQLLLVMTAAAVLATTMRTGPFADESKWTNIGFAVSIVVMAIVSAIVWSLAWHWLLRLAVTLGTALVLGSIFAILDNFGPAGLYVIGSHYLIQALILSSWLGWGPILPARANSSSRYDDPRLQSER